MNRRYKAVPLWLAVLVVLLATACAGLTPDRIAINTLQTTKATADAYMRAVASQYALGRQYDGTTKTWVVTNPAAVVISEDMKTKSIAAYDKFAASAKAAGFALSAITTTAQGDAITAEVQAGLTELLNLLRAFGVKGV
jgi:hypothetical protein